MLSSTERLPDKMGLLRVSSRNTRVNVCTRHLSARDGPANDIAPNSPRAATKAARDAALQSKRDEWEKNEAKKKKRAKVLAASRSLRRSVAGRSQARVLSTGGRVLRAAS